MRPKIHRMSTNLILIGHHRTPVPRTRLTHLPKPVHATVLLDYTPAVREDVWLTVLTRPRRGSPR